MTADAAGLVERGFTDVMATAADNFRLEDMIPHEISTVTYHDGAVVTLSVPGVWRRALHENPRFHGYKFLERAWLEHRGDIVRSVADELSYSNMPLNQ